MSDKIKILFWVSQFPVLSETFIRDQVFCLSQRTDVEVEVYCKHFVSEIARSLNDSIGIDWKEMTVEEEMITPRKGNKYFAILGIVLGLCLQSKIQSKKLLGQLLKHRKKGNLLKKLRQLRYIVNQDFDVIHAHFGPNGIEASTLINMGLKTKLITTFHGYDIRLGFKQPEMYRDLFENSFSVVSISKFNSDALISFGLPEDKIVHIPNGINVNAFAKAKKRNNEELVRFITVARLVEDKALHIAIEALALYSEIHEDFQFDFRIIGEGKLRPELTTLIDGFASKASIRLVGAKSPKEVSEAMAESDVFLLCSLNEALPTVLLEAQASSLPILATNVGAVKNMLIDGVIVNPDNVSAFMCGIEELLNRKDDWSVMGAKGRQHVQDNFDINEVSERLYQLYSKNIVSK